MFRINRPQLNRYKAKDCIPVIQVVTRMIFLGSLEQSHLKEGHLINGKS
jgi:hypothetical protein